ncbi:hypothetical protein TIFTF001_010028 [Ficus carica]|uniref:Uncharacterized protein n=1 Tax=Ficus carica TaxID=3494 RepID=A0AA88D440_FICCA|nr:hypothetical protein TIFTF001_010028 [Ficus carica]
MSMLRGTIGAVGLASTFTLVPIFEAGVSNSEMSDPEKLEAAVISLNEEALAWFQWEDKIRQVRN